MSEITSFGAWIQQRRNQLRRSRTELAQEIGCSPVTIKKIERDERRPSVQIAELLALHLQVPESDQHDFIRRARGEFVARFRLPSELSLTEAQAPPSEADAPKHNLPAQTTTFIGRESELAQITAHLTDPACRLLTILGAGGIGKTRLSIVVGAKLAALQQFTDGITFVGLASIPERTMSGVIDPLIATLADSLGITFNVGDPPEDQLKRYLKLKEKLIVFDNFEHLLDSAEFLSALLAHAPDIKILVTSRESLNLQEEWIHVLEGLSFPVTGQLQQDVLKFGALQLFSQRAKQASAAFSLLTELPSVVRICQLVEGMPLGLELAAAWVRHMPCKQIAQAIEAELDFLTTRLRNVPERHRSIHAVFSHSWEKLTQQEQTVLKKLSVFRGGFDRDAATAVASASLLTLSGFVDKSLLSVAEDGRYHIHQLLLQFLTQALTQSQAENDSVRDQHSQHFFTLVSAQRDRFTQGENLLALLAIERDIDNFRAAFQWAIDHQRQLFDIAFSEALWNFYDAKGWYLEGETLFALMSTKFQPACASTEQTIASPECLLWAQHHTLFSCLQRRLGRLDEAEKNAQQSLRYLGGDDAWSLLLRSWTLTNLGVAVSLRGELIRAERYLGEAETLAKQLGNFGFYSVCLFAHCQIAINLGDYERAQIMAEECLRLMRSDNSQLWISYLLSELGKLAIIRGEFSKALAYLQEGITLSNELNVHSGRPNALLRSGHVMLLQGRHVEAHDYYQQCANVGKDINNPHVIARALWSMGNLAVDVGDFVSAQTFYDEGSRAFPSQQLVGGLGWVKLGLGELATAYEIFCKGLQLMLYTKAKPLGLDAILGIAHLRVRNRQLDRAAELSALVQHHPSSSYEIKTNARRLWDDLKTSLPPESIAEAEARGSTLDLFETAATLLAEETNI